MLALVTLSFSSFFYRSAKSPARTISSCTSCGGRPDGRHRSLVDSTADRSTATCCRMIDHSHTVRWAPLADRRSPRFLARDGGGVGSQPTLAPRESVAPRFHEDGLVQVSSHVTSHGARCPTSLAIQRRASRGYPLPSPAGVATGPTLSMERCYHRRHAFYFCLSPLDNAACALRFCQLPLDGSWNFAHLRAQIYI